MGDGRKSREAASTSEMTRFETEILTTRKNLKSLMDVPGKWIDRAGQHRPLDKLIFDLDSSVNETHGRRERLPSLAAMEHSGIAVKCKALLDAPSYPTISRAT